MTSIITNSSALVALSTLKSISKDLDTTNSRISTGLKVNTAKDNAAYWSIATTTKSDNGQLGAVKDALALGAETVNTQTTGMNAVIDKLNELQKKLTTALSANVDRGKIQSEIDTILTDLSDSASAATQAGENWLSVDSSEGDYNPIAKLVASFTRTGGQIALGTVDVDVDSVKLYDKTTSSGTAATGVDLSSAATAVSAGNLGAAYSSALASFKTAYSTFAAAASTAGFDASTIASDFGDTVNADQLVKFAASAKADYNAALTKYELGAKGTDDRKALDAAEALYTASKSLFSAGQSGLNNAAVVANDGKNGEGGILNKQFSTLAKNEDGFLVGYAVSVDSINISNIDDTDLSKLRAYIDVVDKALGSATDAATVLGTVSTRIDSQQTFVGSLIDANTNAISALVDADMEEESTRLKALQTQQQLGVQTLSIANSSGQNILSLFQ